MTIRNLEYLFKPRSLAIIGASERASSVGGAVTRNVLAGGFAGSIALVNRQHESIAGRPCFHSVDSIDFVPDLAVICTPPGSVPELIAELGERGTRAAIVLTAGLDATNDAGVTMKQAMLDAAKPHLLRVLGPNCVGLLSPAIGLNASFAHAPAHKGRLAFVSQSGALTTALLDWARSRQIGFSHFVSLGEAADVDFGDVIDYLAGDPDTTAILLYIESVKAARKFMSAARAAGRSKRIIAIKAGRAPEGAKAVASHTGSLAGSDDVYDAALRRAGALRVDSMLDLFLAAETLARARYFSGERLAIVTNGGGLAVLAADTLSLHGGKLAGLSPETIAQLNAVLPATWSHGNPIDIIGDAPAARYVDALRPVFEDPTVDALLFLHAPTAIVDSTAIAQAVVPVLKNAPKPSFCCWMGGDAVAAARLASVDAGLPTYDTPEAAVAAFLQVVQHRRNQQMLMETPPSLTHALPRNPQLAQRIVDDHIAAKTAVLSEMASKEILSAYGIDVVDTRTAHDEAEAARIADEIGYPVALKILSPDISHKSDVGGVALDLHSRPMVAAAAQAMQERVRAMRPDARLDGFTVERMVVAKHATELIVGVATDAVFGPTILFGAGGTAVETVRDKAIALPPLNVVLARELITRTRVSRLLAGYRDVPAADLPAIERVLLGVAQLIADVPDIVELDINPLLASADGAIALDARIRVARSAQRGTDRFAIRPYPVQLEDSVDIGSTRCLVRPIRPEDESKYPMLFAKTTDDDIYFRLFRKVSELPHQELARFTQIDYDREMALVALEPNDEIVGVVRSIADPDNVRAEFAILVRSDWSGRGLGYALMTRIIAYSRARGTQELFGDVLMNNRRMLELAKALGFASSFLGYQTTRVSLVLNPSAGNEESTAAG
jgi:acetyltransferase